MNKIKVRSNIGYSRPILSYWKPDFQSKTLVKNFYHFTNGKYRISINQVTKKVKRFFLLKYKNIYPACNNCHELSCCKEIYIGESKHNMATRWGEHINYNHDSKPLNTVITEQSWQKRL